jgi:hypothetical protein
MKTKTWTDRLQTVQPLILQFGLHRSMRSFPTNIERGMFAGAHGWVEADDNGQPIAMIALAHPQPLGKQSIIQFVNWLKILEGMTGIEMVELRCTTLDRTYLRMAVLGDRGREWVDHGHPWS